MDWGLCDSRNSRSGGDSDEAYTHFASAVATMDTPSAGSLAVISGDAPNVRLAPGRVARCAPYSMFSLNSCLRHLLPQIARTLTKDFYRNSVSFRLPDALALNWDARLRE